MVRASSPPKCLDRDCVGRRRTGTRRGNVYRSVREKQGNVVYRQRVLQTVTSLRVAGAPNDNFRKNICLEDDLRSRIFETLACEQALLFGRVKRVSLERVNGRQSRSRFLARFASLAQIGELASRLSNSLCTDVPLPSGKIGRGDSPYFS